MNIELTPLEHTYLTSSSFLSHHIQQLIRNSSKEVGGAYILTLTEDQADEVRDLCGEQLQLVGFDEQYRPTEEGQILETLVDKLFYE